MKRVIKFRAWDSKSNKWFDDFVLYPNGKIAGVNHAYGNIHIMQFTGLLDKNGKEIYEGDIVKIPRDLHIGDEIVDNKGEFASDAFVEWVDGTFRLNKLGDKSKHYYGVIAFGENTDPKGLEVIGNIHENKDLL